MKSVMQVLADTQVDGRFFPRGSRLQVIEAGDSCLVLPDLDAHTVLCVVLAKNLARLTRFRAVLVNPLVSLVDEQDTHSSNGKAVIIQPTIGFTRQPG